LQKLIGLHKIASSVGEHKVKIELGAIHEFARYTRQRGSIETEPDVRIPFWLLKPNSDGPHPLAVLPHGHSQIGHDTHAGVYQDEAHRQKALSQQRDVAVQAVERGFLAIAPATRGLAVNGVPDSFERHGKRDCRSQLMHCLLAGRTAIGERVWDLQLLMDWAIKLPEVDAEHVLMMGNSGGGMATLYTAACDERITVAVPSCSFTTIAGPTGRIYHCDCNMVPGILEWGDLYDVAGLIAPRWLLAVNGRTDKLHTESSIELAAARAKVIFRSSGHPTRFDHRWGNEGHRFYSDLMWPFVMQSLKKTT
jgi:dienelactone hydrolase